MRLFIIRYTNDLGTFYAREDRYCGNTLKYKAKHFSQHELMSRLWYLHTSSNKYSDIRIREVYPNGS